MVTSGQCKCMLFCVVVGRSSYFSLTFSRGQNAFKVKPQFSQLISYSASRNFFPCYRRRNLDSVSFPFSLNTCYMDFQCQNETEGGPGGGRGLHGNQVGRMELPKFQSLATTIPLNRFSKICYYNFKYLLLSTK